MDRAGPFGVDPPGEEWEAANPDWRDVPPDDPRWRPRHDDPDGNLGAGGPDTGGGHHHERQGTENDALRCDPLPIRAPHEIPPRPWAYGHFLLFGQTGALGAIDGGGKGAMAVGIALSMISGKPLLGEVVWRTGTVVIVSYEDDIDEWHRRIAAACIRHGLNYNDAIAGFRFISKPGGKVCFASAGRDGPIFPDGDNIIEILKATNAALVIVDPFNHAHRFDDGNNNVQIAKAAGELNRITRESGAAGLVLHHLRKGSTGSADDLMGATSLRATFRSSRILVRMTPDEAKALDIDKDAWRYSRIAGSKENYAPPPDKATWFKLESVPLGNATVTYPEGDSVAVTTTWQPPAVFDGIGGRELTDIFAAIRRGPGEPGMPFSPHRQSRRWVGHAIVSATGKTEEQAAIVIKRWTETGVLTLGKWEHPVHRNKNDCVELNEAKAAAMAPAPDGDPT